MITQARMNDPEFISQIKNAGISNPTDYIHRQISRIPNVQHSDVHAAGWNERWKDWFRQNPNFSKLAEQKTITGRMV
ncbi:hypothetical protein NI420_003336 [Salmonella enterica]|nr:hypothetical protein [Salmonella enterica]EJJ4248394.1 hypothetical protein [Salmonella enterica]